MESSRSGVFSEQELEPLVGVFRLLSDKTRLNIMLLLSKGERNVTCLCGDPGRQQPTVSHHLGLLRMSNLISSRRDGKQVFYDLSGNVEDDGRTTLQVVVDNFKIAVGLGKS